MAKYMQALFPLLSQPVLNKCLSLFSFLFIHFKTDDFKLKGTSILSSSKRQHRMSWCTSLKIRCETRWKSCLSSWAASTVKNDCSRSKRSPQWQIDLWHYTVDGNYCKRLKLYLLISFCSLVQSRLFLYSLLFPFKLENKFAARLNIQAFEKSPRTLQNTNVPYTCVQNRRYSIILA